MGIVSAITEARGMHSGKDHPPPKQPLNISEVRAVVRRGCMADGTGETG